MLILPNLIIESFNRDLYIFDGEETLSSVLGSVFESDVKVDSLGTELDVEDTGVFELEPAGLIK